MDHATSAAGALVVEATCHDDNHPAENILDEDERTFWSTTGLFPQEFIVALANPTQISKIKMTSIHVRQLTVERSDGPAPERFEKVFDVEVTDRNGRLQTEMHQVNTQAKFLRFVIKSAWDEFAAVHRVSVL